MTAIPPPELVRHFTSTIHHGTYPAIDPKKANLEGKYILLTGASRGIGRATAVALAQGGASGIALLARSDISVTRSAVEEARRPGSELKILVISTDVTSPEQAVAAVARVRDEFGRLDVVINNAASPNPTPTLIAEGDANEWWKVWAVNVRGTYNIIKAALPFMLECGGDKTFLNVSSESAHWLLPNFSSYVISKFALLRLTEQIMAEYGNQGVVAIALHPCSTPTELTEPLIGTDMEALLVDTPELAAHTIVWLAKERRDWLGGRYISSTWDVEEMLAKKNAIMSGDKLKLRMVV